MQPTRSIPTVDLDPYAAGLITAPEDFYHALHAARPVAWVPKYEIYAVGTHKEAAEVLSDHTRFTTSAGIGIQDIRKPGVFRTPIRLLENDPPIHTDLRGKMTKYLSPIVIRKWRDHFETLAKQVVEDAVARGDVDGIRDIAEVFILQAFSRAVGVTLPRDETLTISEWRFNVSGPQNELYEAAVEKAKPYFAWFENSVSREGAGAGSIAEALFDAEDRGEFDPGFATNMLRSFVGGGTDSTIIAVAHTLNKLAQNPDQWALVKANPALVRAAFEEAVRLESSFRVTFRTTVAGAELSGVKLEPDRKIGVFIGAANHDPEKWVDPGKFDITRDTAGVHVGFGAGPHICIGQMIARLEAESLLTAIVRAVARLEPTGEARYKPVNQLRMLDTLPLRLVPA